MARADGKGNLVFALIGPKWYEILPRTLERLGFQIPVTCYEIKVPLEGVDKEKYENERNWRKLRRIAAGNKRKKSILSHLLAAFWTKKVIIVSYYRNLAEEAGNEHQIPVIAKAVVCQYLQQLLDDFNQGKITRLIGTSAIEKLPVENCEIMIALSYQQGSKREEYLRLGKIIKNNRRVNRGFLYSLVSAKSIEEEDYSKRRRWLINYGYRYRILSVEELLEGDITDEAD
ncbi:MAG: hypothetical protein A4E52_00121 [Pelotomaculum sp. PtaB.Bin013]|uniref:ERCC3/RAD25/XPB helicase C-terminal domain-containing protein n=1 Tax=Pelotomaculum isophthalicicum JI TaxID=947010 RepID=A0A9X4H684_9FIRM|nr:hypothetical protein [Pelotomaculum isophthalicicum]MDF9408234.1 hypothetical protein [Pelotomaculum isophthalicicum JI]OPX92119.1 MAG: hypothetical protein A4E52_00121 [Pelotomaculum sp. PtaB.Bin013]